MCIRDRKRIVRNRKHHCENDALAEVSVQGESGGQSTRTSSDARSIFRTECATRVPDSDLRGGSMSPVTRSALVIPSGYASQEVASFIAQLEDLLKRQRDQT